MCTGFIRGQVSLSGSEGRSLGDGGLQSVRELVLNGWALTGKAGVLAAILVGLDISSGQTNLLISNRDRLLVRVAESSSATSETHRCLG